MGVLKEAVIRGLMVVGVALFLAVWVVWTLLSPVGFSQVAVTLVLCLVVFTVVAGVVWGFLL